MALPLLILALTSPTLESLAQDRPAEPFSRDILIAHAAELAKHEYQEPEPRSASEERWTYDQYRAIRFQQAAAIWARGSTELDCVGLAGR